MATIPNRIYKPVTINPKPGFTRTGSFHAGNKPVQLSLHRNPVNGESPGFLRSFSFRNRENENHSSMPCLNATKLSSNSGLNSNNSQFQSQISHNFGTPSSSTLVINSLAYQVLSPPSLGNKTENDLNSQGFSSPSSSTTSNSPQVS